MDATAAVGMEAAEVEKKWAAYRRTRSVAARNALVEHYMPLVDKAAAKMARRLWPRITAEELASAGYRGLIDAVASFDPGRGFKFETYAARRIKGAIRDWQREVDPLGRTGRGFERSMRGHEEAVQAAEGRLPHAAELAERMHLSLPEFLARKRRVMASQRVSLDGSSEAAAQESPRCHSPVDGAPGPAERAERKLLREIIARGLTEQQRLILTLYYYEQLNLASIGAVLGLSESRVCQLHAQLMQDLRARFECRAAQYVA